MENLPACTTVSAGRLIASYIISNKLTGPVPKAQSLLAEKPKAGIFLQNMIPARKQRDLRQGDFPWET